jgi:hypothetical protein
VSCRRITWARTLQQRPKRRVGGVPLGLRGAEPSLAMFYFQEPVCAEHGEALFMSRGAKQQRSCGNFGELAMTYLHDVNALVALRFVNHEFDKQAATWRRAQRPVLICARRLITALTGCCSLFFHASRPRHSLPELWTEGYWQWAPTASRNSSLGHGPLALAKEQGQLRRWPVAKPAHILLLWRLLRHRACLVLARLFTRHLDGCHVN